MVCKMQRWIVSLAPHLGAGIGMHCLAILLPWKLIWSLKFHSAQPKLKISSFGLMFPTVSTLWSLVTGSSSKTKLAQCCIIPHKMRSPVFGVGYGSFQYQTKSKIFCGRLARKLCQSRKIWSGEESLRKTCAAIVNGKLRTVSMLCGTVLSFQQFGKLTLCGYFVGPRSFQIFLSLQDSCWRMTKNQNCLRRSRGRSGLAKTNFEPAISHSR